MNWLTSAATAIETCSDVGANTRFLTRGACPVIDVVQFWTVSWNERNGIMPQNRYSAKFVTPPSELKRIFRIYENTNVHTTSVMRGCSTLQNRPIALPA